MISDLKILLEGEKMELRHLTGSVRALDNIIVASSALRRQMLREIDKYAPISRREAMAIVSARQDPPALISGTHESDKPQPQVPPTFEQIENVESNPRRRQVIELLMTDIMLSARFHESVAYDEGSASNHQSADFLNAMEAQLGLIDMSRDAFHEGCTFNEVVVMADLAHQALANLRETASSKNELKRWVGLLRAACSTDFDKRGLPDVVHEHAQLRDVGQSVRSNISGRNWNPNPRAIA